MPRGINEDSRRLVVLTGNGPEHRYVANRLCLAVPVHAILADVTVRRPSLRRAFRGGARQGVSRVALQVFRMAVRDEAARAAAIRTVLGAQLTSQFSAEDRVIRVRGVNLADARAAVARLQPDALLVYGTSIVGDEMLGQARDLAFGMHTGMSPRYRGADCAFWPVVNGEAEWIGATVHECTPNVDGGPVFSVAAAGWEPDDGLHELFARAVATGTDLYIDVIRRYLAGSLEGEPQDLSIGREYRGYMRALEPELRARWALRRGLLRRRVAAGIGDE
jgi:methionyl-tRNA formyltransferase